jgi:hypothetical protein
MRFHCVLKVKCAVVLKCGGQHNSQGVHENTALTVPCPKIAKDYVHDGSPLQEGRKKVDIRIIIQLRTNDTTTHLRFVRQFLESISEQFVRNGR